MEVHLTVWLTADRLPFMGGTYFPPRRGARGASVGVIGLLEQMKKRHDEQLDEMAAAGIHGQAKNSRRSCSTKCEEKTPA